MSGALPDLALAAVERNSDDDVACGALMRMARSVGLELDLATAGRWIAEAKEDRKNGARSTPEPEDWHEAPHLPGPDDPEPLPLQAFPHVIRAHVESVAAATQTPTDLPALLVLACLSAAVAGRARVGVDARGWQELATIYATAILPPAARKSPVYALLTEPIREYERDERERIGPAYRRARDRVDVAAAALQATKVAAAKGKASPEDLEAARAELEQAEKQVPRLPRLLVSDTTPEALVRLMADQGGAIALLAPEGDPLRIADGRYSDGSARLGELKQAWGGEAITQDRIGRESIHVERPALTLGLCMQPGVLDTLRNARSFRGEGVIGRILWCKPDHGLGSRLTGRDVPALDRAAADRYGAMLRFLLDSTGSALANPDPLTLSRDALDVLYAYEAEVERELADGQALAGIRDWAGKVCGQSVRLAALIELAARAEDSRPLWTEPIGAWAMDAGVRLARALTTHALAVLADMGQDARVADLRYVLRRARELPEASTLRDLYEATRDRPGLETMEDLRPVVDGLARRGCLRLVDRDRQGPGRPPSPLVELHPAFHGTTPNRPPHNPHNSASGSETGNSAGSAGVNPGRADERDTPPPDVFGAEP